MSRWVFTGLGFGFQLTFSISYPHIGILTREKTGFGLFYIGHWMVWAIFWSRCISSHDIVMGLFFSWNSVNLRFQDVDDKIIFNAICVHDYQTILVTSHHIRAVQADWWILVMVDLFQIFVFKRRYNCALPQKLWLLRNRNILKRGVLNLSSTSSHACEIKIHLHGKYLEIFVVY